jgi:alpha-ribazole phosphatase
VLIYLIRHTRTDAAQGLCYGQADIGLAGTFETEKEEILRRLAKAEQPEIVYSSPLFRCRHLADTLAPGEVKTDERLKEMAFGNWELEPWDLVDRDELDRWAANFVERAPPRGESLRSLYQRVCEYIELLLKQSYDTVAVVTHAGVIRCFHVYLTGIPLADIFDIDVACGDVFEVRIPPVRENPPIMKL